MTSDEVRGLFDLAPMSRAQKIVVALTIILSTVDGYDVLSVTFAAPAIAATMAAGKAALGVVLSAGLAGMALGSFLLAPFGDYLGRKPLVLVSLVLMAIGMLLCALATSMTQLALFRVISGLGIGTCISLVNPLAAEFANARRRALAVAIMATGYPIGGVVGGLVSAVLLKKYGWQAVFLAGALAAVVLLPVVARLLPESISFLLGRGRAADLPRINAVLQRCGHAPIAALPAAPPIVKRGYKAVFAPHQIRATAWIAVANFLFLLTVYFVLSWLPQMVVDGGFSASAGSLVSAVMNLVGVFSGLALGILARARGLGPMTGIAIVGFGGALVTLGLIPDSLALFIAAGGVCGLFLFAGVAGSYAIIAATFNDAARATGTGFVLGIGRISSALAPALAGWLFASGFHRASVSAIFGVCALLSGAMIFIGAKTHLAGDRGRALPRFG